MSAYRGRDFPCPVANRGKIWPAEIRQQLEALDDEWHQQHNRFSEQQKCLFIPGEWLGRIEASLQDVGTQIKQARQS